MNGVSDLTTWQYLIFELPLAAGAFMIIMTVVHPHGDHGDGHGGDAGHGAMGHGDAGHGAMGHGHIGIADAGHGHAGVTDSGHGHDIGHSHPGHVHIDHAAHPPHGPAHGHGASHSHGRDVSGFILGLFGARKAPLPLVLEAGLLGWGVFGFCANMFFQVGVSPSALLAMPAIAVAAVGGFATMHVAGATFARFMPEDESSALSRNSLFGIAGEVVYPVSETGGRIHVYDPYGTMHDESCRVAAGQPSIERGRRAMVVDIDAKGTLIVEEAP